MANPANQLHMVTESAQHAQTISASTADSLHGHVTRLTGHVGAVIGSGWAMDQAVSFGTAHQSWADGMDVRKGRGPIRWRHCSVSIPIPG